MTKSKVAGPESSAHPSGSSDQAIGRPGPWQEGRYEEDGKPVDESVITPGGDAAAFRDEVSTPVTLEDYEGKSGEPKHPEKRRP